MKTSMMKLGVFVMMAAIVIFTLIATASADGQKYRKTLHGEYAFTGSGVCTLSPTGFDPDFIPNTPGSAWMGPNFWEGVYTFNHNGKGKMETQQCYNEGSAAMAPIIPTVPYSSGCADLSWEFEYAIDGGAITFTFIDTTYSLVHNCGPECKRLPSNKHGKPH